VALPRSDDEAQISRIRQRLRSNADRTWAARRVAASAQLLRAGLADEQVAERFRQPWNGGH
jgi:hypothetical protein